MMPTTTLFRARQSLLLLALAYPLSGLAAGSASLDFVVGEVFAINAGGAQRSLSKGAQIVSGETLRTGDGRAQLRFDDGAMISLQPNTEFRIDSYQYNGQPDGKERGFFSLLKGGLRTITGLVGRDNKENYKVTTSVATIGIRGTEYTLAYLGADSIAIATGDGAIEVCNGGGCGVLASGDSAVVNGPNGALQRVDFRPQLPPAPPGEPLLPQFSTAEWRNQGGSIQINGGRLVSGGGYSLVSIYPASYMYSPPSFGMAANIEAQFSQTSQLLSGAGFQSVALAESGLVDGVIGWGRWSSGLTPSLTSMADFHYVVGRPTPLAGLGISATYQLAGYTTPSGVAPTGPLSGTLSANFTGAGTMTVAMNLSIPTAVALMAVNTNTGATPVPVSSTFTWDAVSTNVSGGGLFTGVNASHAGATYNTAGISGAAAFKR